MIEKKTIQNDDYLMNGLFSEIKIMKKLKSPNVVELVDVLETSNNYYIIQEFCDGGDLRSSLKKQKYFPEQDAINILKDLLTGFIELLRNGIIHRDMKPENILIKGSIHKLADFGFSKAVDNFQRQMLTSLVGTPLYMSPQILKQEKYTAKSDLWSMGFIYYEMLYGKTPYTANSQYQLVKNIETKPLEFPAEQKVSELSKNFIRKCLQIDEQERIEWTDVYKDPLFQDYFIQFTSQMGQMEDKAKYIINELRQNIYKNKIDLAVLFKKYDFSKDSKLEINEFSKLMQSIDKNLERSEIEYIFNKFDDDKDNTISFEEFTKWLSSNSVQMSLVGQGNNIQRQQTRTDIYQNMNNSTTSQQSMQQQQPQQFAQNQNFQQTSQQQYQMNYNSQQQTYSNQQQQQQQNNLTNSTIAARANFAIQKLHYAIQKYKINLEQLFSKYDKSHDQVLSFQEFSLLLKRVDPELNNEELNFVFTIFDKNGDQGITFMEFYETLQQISNKSYQYQQPHQNDFNYSQQVRPQQQGYINQQQGYINQQQGIINQQQGGQYNSYQNQNLQYNQQMYYQQQGYNPNNYR